MGCVSNSYHPSIWEAETGELSKNLKIKKKKVRRCPKIKTKHPPCCHGGRAPHRSKGPHRSDSRQPGSVPMVLAPEGPTTTTTTTARDPAETGRAAT